MQGTKMEYKKINELTAVVTGGTPSTRKNEYWDNGDIPWLQSGCCQNCDVDSTEKYITKEGYNNSSTHMMPADTVMIALTGATAGKVGYLKFEACGNQSITGILPCESLNQRYLFFYLLSQREKILADCVGGAQAHISQSYVKNMTIPILAIKEQEQIVGELTKLSNIVSLRQEEIQQLDALIKARFVELFGDENNSKNWDVVNIEEVADVQVGVVIKPSQYYTDKSEGVRTFRSLNIGAGFIKDNDWVYFTKEGHQKNSKSILKKDDLLIVRSGAPGTACVVTEEYAGCNAVDIIIAHPDCKKVNPYYLCTFTNMPHGKKQIDEGIGGAAQQHFNVGKYNKLQLMLPPKTLQDEFAGFIKQVDKSKFDTMTLAPIYAIINLYLYTYFYQGKR